MPTWKLERGEFNEQSYKKMLRQLEWILSYLDGENISSIPSSIVTAITSSQVGVVDAGGYFTGSEVESVLQQLGSTILNIPTSDLDLSINTPLQLINSSFGSTLLLNYNTANLTINASSQLDTIQNIATTDAVQFGSISNTIIYIDDTGGYFVSSELKLILQQIGSTLTNISSSDLNLNFDTPLENLNSTVQLNYNTANLTINASSQLDTIQNINTTDSPHFRYNVYETTVSGSLASTDSGLVNVAGNITLTLPSLPDAKGTWFNFTNKSTKIVTLDGNTTDLIYDSTTFDLYEAESLKLIASSSAWFVG